MTTLHTDISSPIAPRTAAPDCPRVARRRRRSRGLRHLAAGYRLMAWRALRDGDAAAAAMNAACSKALRDQARKN